MESRHWGADWIVAVGGVQLCTIRKDYIFYEGQEWIIL